MSIAVAAPQGYSSAPPADLRVRLAPGVALRDGGRLLVGGSPARLVLLTGEGAVIARRWRDGGPVGAQRAARLLARRFLDGGILVPDPMLRPTTDLAVVVPVHGREPQLRRCLAAIAATAQDAAIVVVDDGSPDPVAIATVAAAHGAALVRHAAPLGPAAARNTGFAHTDEPFVAFVDSDVTVEPGCLARLLGHLDDPAVGAVAPRILAADRDAGAVAGFEARHSSLDLGPRAARVTPDSAVPYVPSATLVARRVAFGLGYDEAMHVGEDVDLVWRVVASGWTVRYDPSATVRHEHRTTVRGLLARRFAYATSVAPLAARHPGALPALHVDAATGVLALAVLRQPWLAAALAFVSIARVRSTLHGRIAHPTRLAAELAARSLPHAAWSLAHACRRTWWPLLTLLATRRPRAAAVLGGAVAAGLVEARPARPSAAALCIADDAVAGAGTWWSCLRHRRWTPLAPARRRGALGARRR